MLIFWLDYLLTMMAAFITQGYRNTHAPSPLPDKSGKLSALSSILCVSPDQN